MTIRVIPQILHAIGSASVGSNVECLTRICRSDLGQDVFIDPLLGDCPLSTPWATFWLLLVFVIQPELHGTKHQIQRLQNVMLFGVNFSQLILSN